LNKIIFTGTAPGFPSKDRACSSFLLKTGSKLYQFDAGEGFSGSVLRLGIKHSEIEKIFISHLHPDHITGLFLELQLMYLTNRRKPLDIYVPAEAVKGLERAVDLFYLFKEKFPFRFKFKPIKPNPVFRNNQFTITGFPNRHLNGNTETIKKYRKPNMMQSYSYIIKIGNKRILYSGDIESETDIIKLLDDIHTIIVEGLHVDLKKIIEMCAIHRIKRLVLTHLEQKIYDNPSRLFEIAGKTGLKKLIIAYDGLQLRL